MSLEVTCSERPRKRPFLHLGGCCCNQTHHSVTPHIQLALWVRGCLHWATMRRVPLFLPLALCVGLAACAAAGSTPAVEWRVLVKTVQPHDDTATIVRRASEASGVPARYVAAVSPQWHGLSLACGDEVRCAAALQRLRADTAFFEAVQRDERRQPHAPSSSNPSS